MPSTSLKTFAFLMFVTCSCFFAAQATKHSRISQRIDNSRRSAVRGNVHRFARKEFDRGPVDNSMVIDRVTITLKPTAEQESALETLLREQQDPASPNYHRWLSPEEFADRFGVAPEDFQQVGDWLRSQGFTITETARSRRWISITGTAAQFNQAFQANLHSYMVDGNLHFANASEPTVPDALHGVVVGFQHLNDFRPPPRYIRNRVKPNFTDANSGFHFVAPDDFATIYDLHSLYTAGIDGTGQTIAVVGQTDILLPDIRAFRLSSGLPQNDPQVMLVPGTKDPGVMDGDLGEADLDIEWSGAVAPKAKIIFVNSGVDAFDAFQYAIDQNVAPVVSISYGDCEPNWTVAQVNNFVQLGQQANAQGMTISSAAGDAGAADCEGLNSSVATTGLNVDIPAALPYVTGVGGTTLYDPGNVWNSTTQAFGTLFGKPQPPLWSNTNNSANGSALSYIPEIAWNDGWFLGVAAGGGGKSTNFTKPTWQTGPGVPNDSARDLPDISFSASPVINGYVECSGGDCVNSYYFSDGSLDIVGGTSVGAPSFAGVVALLNQKLNTRLGNANPILYKLATTAPTAFHDITVGGNMVPCQTRTPNCGSSGFIGFAAGPGYDLATGLGSLDITKLVLAWPTQ